QYKLEHLVDFMLDGKSLLLAKSDLPDGGFGFEYCCGRSFEVDNVLIEVFFFKQKTAYEIGLGIPAEPLFRSLICLARSSRTGLDMSHILFMVEILLLTF